MGCFLGCFGGAKAKRGRRPKVLPRNTNYERQESQLSPCSLNVPTYSLKPPTSEIPGISVLDQRSDVVIEEKADKTEKLECSKPKIRKKVSFDLQVKTYSEIPSQDVLKFSPEKERKGVSECELAETESQKLTPTKDHSSATTTGSFPASHRYQNCTNSDGEVDDVDNDLTDDAYDEDDDDDDDDDDNDVGAGREMLFEWYPSSSFESETTGVSPSSIKKEAYAANLRLTMGVGHARDRSQYVHAVLNPVANVSEWKALKSRDPKTTPLLKERKENIPSNEGLIKFNSGPRQEMRVDASLSNWLSPTETVGEAYSNITEAENPKKYKDSANRAVFGLLTNEQVSEKPPQRSPYR